MLAEWVSLWDTSKINGFQGNLGHQYSRTFFINNEKESKERKL